MRVLLGSLPMIKNFRFSIRKVKRIQFFITYDVELLGFFVNFYPFPKLICNEVFYMFIGSCVLLMS